METQVTMSLQRYKVLEAYEKAFDLMDKNKSFTLFGDKYFEIHVFEADESIKYFIERYDYIERRLDSIRDKIRAYDELKPKPDLYKYLSDTLYMPLK